MATLILDRWLVTTGIVFVIFALALLLGGVWLIRLGGSAYYLVAGAALAVCGALIIARRRESLWLYALLLLGSLAWAIAEVRFDWWQLVPRVDLWFVLGAWLLLPFINRRLVEGTRGSPINRGGRVALFAVMTISAVVALYAMTQDYDTLAGDVPASRMAQTATDSAGNAAHKDWTAYGGSGYGNRYAAASQITPGNAAQLKLAWTFHTGDLKGPGDPLEIANEVTPLKANGLLYICTPHAIVIALDPDTGEERWRFDPKINRDAK